MKTILIEEPGKVVIEEQTVFFADLSETIIQSQKDLRLLLLTREKKNWQIALRFQIRQDALQEAF